jgi:hypothetical protein
MTANAQCQQDEADELRRRLQVLEDERHSLVRRRQRTEDALDELAYLQARTIYDVYGVQGCEAPALARLEDDVAHHLRHAIQSAAETYEECAADLRRNQRSLEDCTEAMLLAKPRSD